MVCDVHVVRQETRSGSQGFSSPLSLVKRQTKPTHSIDIGGPYGLFSPTQLGDCVLKGDVCEDLVKTKEPL